MLEPLRRFLKNPKAGRAEALSILSMVFLLMFMAQIVVAVLLALTLSLFFGTGKSSSPLLAQILIVLAFLQLPLAITLPQLSAKAGGKQAALAASIMAAVFFSIPAHFASFALLTGAPAPYFIILLAILMVYYALGLMMIRGFARLAVQETEVSNQELEVRS
jgi:small-conductance mechanosensitive channel